jgi:hypothetical protein
MGDDGSDDETMELKRGKLSVIYIMVAAFLEEARRSI